MKEPLSRYGTKQAMDELAIELNLPNEDWMQDWPFETVNSNDIDRYIEHYKIITDEDKKFVLMAAIIQAVSEQKISSDFEKKWNIIKPMLEIEFKLHEYTIHDWCCFETKNIEECWTITPNLRALWTSNN